MLEQAPNTHTIYTDLARKLKKANDDIAQTRKYLDPASPHYLPAYIEQMEELRNSANPPEGIEKKMVTARANLASYQARAESARQALAEYPAKLSELEASNNIYKAPPGKVDDYLYVMDEESCQASCVNWRAVAENPGQELVMAPAEQYRFQGRTDIELTGEQQTDALRIWNHNVCVDGLCITDNRCYEEAHRDAIQLIPPALGEKDGDGQYIRLADQMAGTIMERVTVQSCRIQAPNGPLQGIFASDGMQRHLKILDNDIATKGAHSISIAGLLDGGEISGNTLRQVAGGPVPRIGLYPARIGGNMADDGVVCILSFAAEEGQESMAYGPVSVTRPNQWVSVEGQAMDVSLEDMRALIPDNFLKLGLGLSDFHYHAYLRDYSRLTVGEYRQRDPVGVQNMLEWLRLRVQEFAHGRDPVHPLGQPGSEQKAIGERFLQPALAALQDGSVEAVRLVDLEYTAIRSFAMKRLAILNGKVEPLINIALLNARRELTLRFLLEPAQLANRVNIGFLEGNVVCLGSGQALPNLGFSLFFAPDSLYQGSSDINGRIAMDGLPLGPCVLQLTDEAFSLTTAATRVGARRAASGAGLATGLLADFRRKIPVVEAWLAQAAGHEAKALAAIERELTAADVNDEAGIGEKVRENCLTAMGLVSSRREPYRLPVTLVVNCPSVNKERMGCLMFVFSLIRRLFGR